MTGQPHPAGPPKTGTPYAHPLLGGCGRHGHSGRVSDSGRVRERSPFPRPRVYRPLGSQGQKAPRGSPWWEGAAPAGRPALPWGARTCCSRWCPDEATCLPFRQAGAPHPAPLSCLGDPGFHRSHSPLWPPRLPPGESNSCAHTSGDQGSQKGSLPSQRTLKAVLRSRGGDFHAQISVLGSESPCPSAPPQRPPSSAR